MSPKPYLKEISLKREKLPAESVYPFSIPAIRQLSTIRFHAHVTFFIGDNGSGKSTLLEALALALGFNPEGGTKNFNFSTRASHSELFRYLKLVRSFRRPRDGFFFRAESYFNVATEIERLDQEMLGSPIIGAYGGRQLHEQSHGESFVALLENRFFGRGLYILDEPEAALSPMKQLAVLRRIHELVQLESQFIIATHSPILLSYPNATIQSLSANGFTETRYHDTEQYRVTKNFLLDPGATVNEMVLP